MHERSSRSVPSRLHQFCTSRQQLPPTTWYAGGQLSRRPFRWLAEEQSRLLNRRLRASAISPDHLLALGTKDQAAGHVWHLATSPNRCVHIVRSIRPRFRRPTSASESLSVLTHLDRTRVLFYGIATHCARCCGLLGQQSLSSCWLASPGEGPAWMPKVPCSACSSRQLDATAAQCGTPLPSEQDHLGSWQLNPIHICTFTGARIPSCATARQWITCTQPSIQRSIE